MFLFIILALMLIILLVVVGSVLAIGGAGFILIFGDVIVCAAILAGIMYLLGKRKKK